MVAAEERVPTVVVDHVDIHYRVFGTGEHRAAQNTNDSAWGAFSRAGHRTVGGGEQEVHAIRDVSFVAYRGESIGLIGRNGSGKSTLLRAVADLMPPSSGRIWVNGRSTLMGVNAVLVPSLSGVRNIQIGCQALGLSRREVERRQASIIEFSGLGEAINFPMRSYSSGMSARLKFAISTAVVPDILVVDEALATGDADFKKRAQERIAEIRQQAGTVFMVSHSNTTIRAQCDRVIWLDSGEILRDGPVEDVLAAYEEKYPGPAAKKKPAVKKSAGGGPAGGKSGGKKAGGGQAGGGKTGGGQTGGEQTGGGKTASSKPANAHEKPAPTDNPRPAQRPSPDQAGTKDSVAPKEPEDEQAPRPAEPPKAPRRSVSSRGQTPAIKPAPEMQPDASERSAD